MPEGQQNSLEGLVLDGKYRLVKRVGSGGMGHVYRGQQLSTGGRVAVKVMDSEDRPERTLSRFRYEAETTAQLSHPNTVRILDFGEDQGLFFLVMEFLPGTDLTRFLRPGGQSDAFVSHVLFQVACSLTEAHSRGVIHRDIKPNNIMLLQHVGHPSFVKVIDFGIARAISGPGHGTRGILGTIGYIAPESTESETKPDARTDLYALGCVAYELATGQLPFEGITHKSAPMDILEAHISGVPTHVSQVKPELNESLAELIMALLAKDPEDRPKSAGELVQPLHAIRSLVSDGVAFSIDVPPAEPASGDEERQHADVTALNSQLLNAGLTRLDVVGTVTGESEFQVYQPTADMNESSPRESRRPRGLGSEADQSQSTRTLDGADEGNDQQEVKGPSGATIEGDALIEETQWSWQEKNVHPTRERESRTVSLTLPVSVFILAGVFIAIWLLTQSL